MSYVYHYHAVFKIGHETKTSHGVVKTARVVDHESYGEVIDKIVGGLTTFYGVRNITLDITSLSFLHEVE